MSKKRDREIEKFSTNKKYKSDNARYQFIDILEALQTNKKEGIITRKLSGPQASGAISQVGMFVSRQLNSLEGFGKVSSNMEEIAMGSYNPETKNIALDPKISEAQEAIKTYTHEGVHAIDN